MPKIRALILDDKHRFLAASAERLQREGIECKHVHTVEEALAALAQCRYEACIADGDSLSSEDSERIEHALREDDAPYLILVTAEDPAHLVPASLSLRTFRRLRKPCHFGDLLHGVRQAAAAKRSLAESADLAGKAAHAEQQLRQLLEAASDSIISVDATGTIVMANDAAVGLFGYDGDELLGASIEMLIPAALRERHRGLREQYQAHPHRRRMGSNLNILARRKDGTEVPVDIALSHVDSPEGVTVTAIIRDMSERKRSEEALRASEERLRILYDNNPSMYFTINTDLAIDTANQYGARQLGYEPSELIGRQAPDTIISPESQLDFAYNVGLCLEEPEQVHQWEGQMICRDGEILWIKQTARAAMDNDGDAFVFMVCEDITEARELSQQVSHQATHDALTGLVNRSELERRLAHLIGSARTDCAAQHAICYLDLDQFKVVNDTSGHAAGDELLTQIAQLLRRHVRHHDTVARLGGDEFAILLEHCSAMQVEFIANAIRKSIADYLFAWEGQRFSVGVSIGVVPINQHTEDVTSVLRAADSACYVAKDGGRNRIYVYREDNEEIARRRGEMSWVTRINDALVEGRFELLCQPIVPVIRGAEEPAHFELLLRLHDPAEGYLSPGTFLAAAERYNLADRIDRWVVNAALAWMAEDAADSKMRCSINLSGQSLGQPEFLEFVTEKLLAYGVSPEKVCFEITETAAIANLARAQAFIGSLKKLGCLFALDDFGSGLSSFAYLHNLPVDVLKIDGSFVVDLPTDPVKLAIVRSINEVGHTMGKKTVAEFVESQAVLEKLRELGVDYAQGFAIGKPRPLSLLQPAKAIG